MPTQKQDITILLPMAGIGRKIRSGKVKHLLEINGEAIINRQVRMLSAHFPRSEIVVIVGYQADELIEKIPEGIKIVENERFEESNVVRSLAMGLRVASYQRLLLVYGDLIFNENTLNNITERSCVVVDSSGQIRSEEVGVITEKDKVLHLSYGVKTKKWAQIAYLENKELELFKLLCTNKENKNWQTFEALNEVIKNGGKIHCVEPPGMKVIEVDTLKDLHKAEKF